MPKDIPSSEIINYRLNILENRIASLDQRIDSLISDNSGSSNKINMEILNLLMSYIKSDHQNHNIVNNNNLQNNNEPNTNKKDNKNTEADLHKMQINAFNRMGTL